MVEKEASVEKYLFIGFIVVILSVNIVDKNVEYSGFAIKAVGPLEYNEKKIINFCYEQSLYSAYVDRVNRNSCWTKGNSQTRTCIVKAVHIKTPEVAFNTLEKCLKNAKPIAAKNCLSGSRKYAVEYGLDMVEDVKKDATVCKKKGLILASRMTTPCDAFCYNPCGNGVIEKDEECDDGNTVDIDECSNDCKKPKVCGFGDGPGYVCGKKTENAAQSYTYCVDRSLKGDIDREPQPHFYSTVIIRSGSPEINGCKRIDGANQVCNCVESFNAVGCAGQIRPASLDIKGDIKVLYSDGHMETFNDNCYNLNRPRKYYCLVRSGAAMDSDRCPEGNTCVDGIC